MIDQGELYRNIDDVVQLYEKGNTQAADMNGLEEKLDQFDLEKLKSIYNFISEKNGNLLRRQHLCKEIMIFYQKWLSERGSIDHAENFILEQKVVHSWLLDDRHSFKFKEYHINHDMEPNDFGCNDKTEFYAKCGKELTLRSDRFSRIASENRTLKEKGLYEELIDLYLGQLYQGYDSANRDWLLVLIVGINLFNHHITRLAIPDRFGQDDTYFAITFDVEQPRLGIYHVKLPILDGLMGMENTPGVTDRFTFPHKYICLKSVGLKFSLDSRSSSSLSRMDEIFTQL